MANENLMYGKKVKRNSIVYIFILILSFIWRGLYEAVADSNYTLNFGFGDIFSQTNLSAMIANAISYGLAFWLGFELLFWIYRYFLSFKIYSFVVPMDSLKAETRLFMIIRNLILGLVFNLCFFMPYLFIYQSFFDLTISLLVLIFYAKHLNKVYSDSIIGHFVFKNFCYPIFIYEGIDVLIYFWMVIA